MYAIHNDEVDRAMTLFENLEGSDIHPAGGVALGALMEAVESGAVDTEDVVALNITGGGEKKIKAETRVHYLEPFARFSTDDIHSDGIEEKIEAVLNAC
jgi:cysteate synthase